MKRTFRSIALTLAGCGLLAGSALSADPARMHDNVRARVLAGIGTCPVSAEAVRAALRDDPEFGILLQCLCRRTLFAVCHAEHGEDALQETLLKTWKGRPEIFLKDHDEVLRYLTGATRRNLATQWRRASAAPGGRSATAIEELPSAPDSDPGVESAVRDVLEQLARRLGPEEREVLAQRLAGAHSERQVAAALGGTRYAAGRATERIRRELERLLGRA